MQGSRDQVGSTHHDASHGDDSVAAATPHEEEILLLADSDLNRLVTVSLSETETITLFDIPALCVNTVRCSSCQ